jgi:branched-chain amino acid transport system substrate-binding protein
MWGNERQGGKVRYGKYLTIMVVVALALLGVFALGACGGESTPPAATSETTAAASGGGSEEPQPVGAEAEEIVIGVVNSTTGENALNGAEQKWAQQKAVDDINAKGGVDVGGKQMKLKLVFADDKSSPEGAAAAMERLAKIEKVKLALGSNTTPYNLAAATVAEKYKVYYHINTSWIDFIEAENFTLVSDMFEAAALAAETPFKIFESMPEAERPNAIATLMEDNPDGQGFGGGFKAFADQYGYEMKLQESYTPGTKDFSSTILKLKQNNIEAVLWLGSPPDSITLVRQMKEANYAPKYLHGWKGFWTQEFQSSLAKDANYIIHDGFWAEDLPYPGAKELGQAYRDAHNGLDSVSIGLPYAAVQVLAEAIENAGSTEPTAVRDAVWNQEFKGTTMGDVKYNEKGTAYKPFLALQWVDGERKIVYPAEASGGYQLQWMPDWQNR